MINSDVFILLIDCQYEKNYYQNRNRIRTPLGLEYITVPVRSSSLDTLIMDKEIHGTKWQQKYLDTIRYHYKKAPHYSSIMPQIEECVTGFLRDGSTLLWKLNADLIHLYMDILDIDTHIELSTWYGVEEKGSRRIAELVRCCFQSRNYYTRFGDTCPVTYLSGPGGRNYLDCTDFRKYNIEVAYNDFKHPQYQQLYEPFMPGASALDLLMNHSPREARAIIESGTNITYQ